MLFNSFEFLFLYLPMVFGGYFLIARSTHRLAAAWLALASVFFYGWWNPRFVALLLASVVFNYLAARAIDRSKPTTAKRLLIAAVTANLLLLGVFKYANFFIASVNGLGGHLGVMDIVLPLGISFFTFTQIAFLVDVYRGQAREYNFVHYLLFVTWFPHLIAGPVLHHKQMMPQFTHPSTYRLDTTAISLGLSMLSLGLFKKVIIADKFAQVANPVFDSAATGADPMFIAAWAGVLAYALQIYFDFSGYSDMAIGLSRMFNVKLPLNFNSPYKAANIIDFWRRWHMTLSAFLRDYLYVALGGNRKGTGRRYVNLFVTMLLGGLWHGAGWNFVLWGALHGAYLTVNHAWRALTGRREGARNWATRGASVALTFAAVAVAWVPFRATSWDGTRALWKGMAGLNGIALPPSLAPVLGHLSSHVEFEGALPGLGLQLQDVGIYLGLGLLVAFVLPNSQQWFARYAPAWDGVDTVKASYLWCPDWKAGAIVGALFALAVLSFTQNSPFLYFQF
jgi:D-alanyl-lipoteichoic acid acyltransferase DltB (MBOAT superfamily)